MSRRTALFRKILTDYARREYLLSLAEDFLAELEFDLGEEWDTFFPTGNELIDAFMVVYVGEWADAYEGADGKEL